MEPYGAGAQSPRAARIRPKVGFFGGVGAFFDGIGFVVGTPSVWPNAIVPMATAAVLIVVVFAMGLWGGSHLAASVLGVDPSGWANVASWSLKILLGAAAFAVAVIVAISFSQPLSGWALDGLVRKRARRLGARDFPHEPTLHTMFRSMRAALTALAVVLPIFIGVSALEFAFPPFAFVGVPIKLVVWSLFVAWDFLDYPLGLRGVGIRQRLTWMTSNFGAVLGFGVASAAVLLIPGIGLFVLPMGVAGATALVEDVERGAPGG